MSGVPDPEVFMTIWTEAATILTFLLKLFIKCYLSSPLEWWALIRVEFVHYFFIITNVEHFYKDWFLFFCWNWVFHSYGLFTHVLGFFVSFTHTVNVTVFVSGTFDLFDVMCKQQNRTALNPFLNGVKKVTLMVYVNGPSRLLLCEW